MAQVVREVRETSVQDEAPVAAPVAREDAATVLERVIYFIGGFIMAIIALRIILSLLGANRGNAFASLIYGISYPFVAPFFGLFNYRMQYGVARFEFESLIALIVWGLITVAVAKLVTIARRPRVV